MKLFRRLFLYIGLIYLLLLAIVFFKQRSLMFFPSHDDSDRLGLEAGLVRWVENEQYLGMKREPTAPARVWLFTHGNGGQAAGRTYVMRYFQPTDAVYIVEYPGYGDQPGSPIEAALNTITERAYRQLQSRYGSQKICVLGESLGSGPASHLGSLADPPRRIVLVVPFDDITRVAQGEFPWIPVRLLMRDHWNNGKALSAYQGRLDIWGAAFDEVIPVGHARRLARSLPRAQYHEIKSGHGWADAGQVDLSE